MANISQATKPAKVIIDDKSKHFNKESDIGCL